MEEVVFQLINPTNDKLNFNVGGSAIANAYNPNILPTVWEWVEYTNIPLIPQDLNNRIVSGIEGTLGSILATNILDNTFAANAYVYSIDTSVNGLKYAVGLTDFLENEIADKNNILEYCYFVVEIYYVNPFWNYLVYENQILVHTEILITLPPEVGMYYDGFNLIYYDYGENAIRYTSTINPNLVLNFSKGVRYVLQTFQEINDIEIELSLPTNWNITPSNQSEINDYKSEGEKLSILSRQLTSTAIMLDSITIYQSQNNVNLLPYMEIRQISFASNEEKVEKINLKNQISPEQAQVQINIPLAKVLNGEQYIHFIAPPQSVNLIQLLVKKRNDWLLELVKKAGMMQAKYYEQFDFECDT